MFKEKIKTLKQFHNFIKERNLLYLYPIFFAFLIVMLLIIVAELTPAGPIIYTIF